MKRNKMGRVIALMLAFMLVFLVACGDRGNGGAAGEGGVGRIHEARDFGGRTLTIGAWWENSIIEIAWGDPPDPFETADYYTARMIYDNARRVERVFNVQFAQEVVPDVMFMEQLTSSVLTGEPFADVVMLEGWMQTTAIGTLIQPWNTGNLPGSDVLGPQRFAGPVNQDLENIWTIYPHGVHPDGMGLGINLDIINADGLPNPIDLFEAGEWTWPNMLELMRDATRATGADGITNQFGLAAQPGDFILHLIAANDGMIVDTELNYALDHPHTLTALEFAEQIFHERLWASEAGGVMDTGNFPRNFFSGAVEGNAALFPLVTWAIPENPPAFEFGFVPFPLGPDNTTGNSWMSPTRQSLGVTVGTDWEVYEILIIMEELFAWAYDDPELMFEAGAIGWMRDMFLDEADVQRAVYTGLRGSMDVGRDVPTYYWIGGDFAEFFWNREMNVTQAVEYLRGPHQELLNFMFR